MLTIPEHRVRLLDCRPCQVLSMLAVAQSIAQKIRNQSGQALESHGYVHVLESESAKKQHMVPGVKFTPVHLY